MPTSLTRRVTFAAAHRYRVPTWTDEENARVFGSCARPNFHGHNYTCDVTVSGDVDPATGFVVNLEALDRALRVEVRERFDHANINLDVAEFADGRMIPTGENVARFVFDRLRTALPDAIRLVRVTIAEDPTLSVTYEP